MDKHASLFDLTDAERAELESRARSMKLRADAVRRAKLILLLDAGATYQEARAALGYSTATISTWKKRFLEHRIDGLKSQYKGSKPTVLTPQARQGLFRFFPGVVNGNAESNVTLGANPTAPVVDLAGNPVRPAAATGDLQTISVFNYDPVRTGFDSTGFIQRFLADMPLPNDYRGGDGLNTAIHRWVRPGDTLVGGQGADRLVGGSGSDTGSYQSATTGVTVDLSNNAVNTGEAAGDLLFSVENLIGSRFNDVLRGSDGMNVIEGRIETKTFTGNLHHDLVRLADGGSLLVETRPTERSAAPGERARVAWYVNDTVIINEP